MKDFHKFQKLKILAEKDKELADKMFQAKKAAQKRGAEEKEKYMNEKKKTKLSPSSEQWDSTEYYKSLPGEPLEEKIKLTQKERAKLYLGDCYSKCMAYIVAKPGLKVEVPCKGDWA